VTFAEVGRGVTHTLIATNRARGQLRFLPDARPSRAREIVAFVNQNGLQRDRFSLARFTAPPLSPLLRVSHVTLRGRTLAWQAQSSATAYSLTITGSGTPFATVTRHTRLQIPASVGTPPYRVDIVAIDQRNARIGPTAGHVLGRAAHRS
jgi:hypothetical protein